MTGVREIRLMRNGSCETCEELFMVSYSRCLDVLLYLRHLIIVFE